MASSVSAGFRALRGTRGHPATHDATPPLSALDLSHANLLAQILRKITAADYDDCTAFFTNARKLRLSRGVLRLKTKRHPLGEGPGEGS